MKDFAMVTTHLLETLDLIIERHVDGILSRRLLQRYLDMWARVRERITMARMRLTRFQNHEET